MNRCLLLCQLVVVSIVVTPPSSLLAQVAGAGIAGAITDQAGAPVAGATVTVTNTATSLRRVVISTSDGIYATPGLAPGEYVVDVALTGFKATRRAGVRIATRETARVDVVLAIGDLQEIVTVVDRP